MDLQTEFRTELAGGHPPLNSLSTVCLLIRIKVVTIIDN